ncbi:hypothetical protein [Xanthomonas euvesicatoria]|uniref:hypothetical protein n=1 Tax=Xanthomonas euvesicatoria TaxID=456327 RepID=UPI0011119074|nr:hypothetical protein [Xanthomonas euvesicatoria]
MGDVAEKREKQRRLHLAPTLYLDAESGYFLQSSRLVRLVVETTTPGVAVVPFGERPKVTRAYPNQRYLVGGLKASRFGWWLDLPADCERVDVSFHWTLPMRLQGPKQLLHELELVLEGDSELFSMDSVCWPPGRHEAPIHINACGSLCDDISSHREVMSKSFGWSESHIRERMNLPGVNARYLAGNISNIGRR